MNKEEEKVYQFNKYVLGYDKGQKDRSCLTISKIQNGNIYVMSSLYDGSAEVISLMLDNLQQELERYKNIIEEAKEYCKSHFKCMVADEEAERLLDILNKTNKE